MVVGDNKHPQRIRGVLLDFDGVISKNSVKLLLKFVHSYVNRFTNLPYSIVKDYFKIVTSFPMKDALELFFKAVGLSRNTYDFLSKYNAFTGIDGENIEIEKDFYTFLNFCRSRESEYMVLSMAGSSNARIKLLKNAIDSKKIIETGTYAKANPELFFHLRDTWKINSEEWLLIDDSPLALRSARLAGFNTVMMINDVFTEEDYMIFKDFIGRKAHSFTDISDFIESFGHFNKKEIKGSCMNMHNSKMGGYTITESLYENRSFVISRATTAEHLPVILKYPQKTISMREARDKLSHEHTISKSIKTFSMVKTISLEESIDCVFLVLEDHRSVPINAYLENKPKSPREICPILIGIVEALSDIHNARIIHNSLHPSSILIDKKTGRITIADFQSASKVPYTVKHFSFRASSGESAAYMSPEQSGMMNRSVDYRTDYYSLGVIFYEMLVRRLPFQNTDPIELAYAHISGKPGDLHDIDPGIPLALSSIVMKLLAKKAEDRYQGCSGIIYDLERCIALIDKEAKSATFPLGEKDIGSLFYIPEKLYGRDTELGILSRQYEEAFSFGEKPILVFISGAPGIGKSSLILEFGKSVVNRKGFFISGTYDRFRRYAPYSAVISAFRNLVDLVLADRDTPGEVWGSRIKETLGINTGVVTDVIPSLARITGQVQPPPSLSPSDTEIRFSYVFQNFVKLFADKGHPLVLVLEDLQWADCSSIKWLDTVLRNPDLTNFMLIGSYREDEIDDGHPFKIFLAGLNGMPYKKSDIRLGPLALDDIGELLSETLHTKRDEAKALAAIVNTQTSGNPFFVNEFVRSLYLGRLFGNLVTDNVEDFVAGKILALPKETQDLLRVVSCAGILIYFDALSIVSKKTTDEIIDILRPAIDEGLVIKLESEATFGHDRVREAVYRMLAEDEKIENHYRLGNALLDITENNQIEDRIFPIVHQLNMARNKIKDPDQRVRLARLNLKAGLKSKYSTAYEPALVFFRIAVELLPADSWAAQFELTLSLAMETCELEYLTGNHERADACLAEVLRNARDRIDMVRVYKAQIPLNTAIGRANYALEQGRTACALLKIKLPVRVTQVHIMLELVKALFHLKKRNIKSFAVLPETTDLRSLSIIELLMNMTLPAYISSPDSVPYLMIKMLNFSLQRGNSPYSAYAYAGFGLILACVLGNVDSGYELGKYALELGRKIDTRLVQCKVNFIFGNLINHWKKPLREDIPILEQGTIAGFESGDITFASFCVNHNMAHSIFCGENLESAKRKGGRLLDTMRRFKRIESIDAFYLFYQCAINLADTGNGESLSIDGEYFKEEPITDEWARSRNHTDLGFYHVIKQFLCYLAGDYESCIRFSEAGKKYLGNMLGMFYVRESYYYHALALLAVLASADKAMKKKYRTHIITNREKIRKWARICPANCLHKLLFIDAERAAVDDTVRDVAAMYDEAIGAAHRNGFTNEEAMICEHAALYCSGKGMGKAGEIYLQRAHDVYFQWGAKWKCGSLRHEFPDTIVDTK